MAPGRNANSHRLQAASERLCWLWPGPHFGPACHRRGGDGCAEQVRSLFPDGRRGRVKYLDGDFRVLRPGAFVRCAITGTPIPLEELKYWSVDLQEAYVSPEVVLQRHVLSR